MEITNPSDAEFKILVIRMLKKLTGYCNSIKKTHAEMKVALSEINKNLHGTNSGEDEAKNQINDLEHKEGKSIQSEQQKEKRIKNKQTIKKNEDRFRDLWNKFKITNIQIIRVPEGEQEEQEI